MLRKLIKQDPEKEKKRVTYLVMKGYVKIRKLHCYEIFEFVNYPEDFV